MVHIPTTRQKVRELTRLRDKKGVIDDWTFQERVLDILEDILEDLENKYTK